jgi:hypothetical protein
MNKYYIFYEGKALKYQIRFVMQPFQNPPLCSGTAPCAKIGIKRLATGQFDRAITYCSS